MRPTMSASLLRVVFPTKSESEPLRRQGAVVVLHQSLGNLETAKGILEEPLGMQRRGDVRAVGLVTALAPKMKHLATAVHSRPRRPEDERARQVPRPMRATSWRCPGSRPRRREAVAIPGEQHDHGTEPDRSGCQTRAMTRYWQHDNGTCNNN